MGYIAFHNNKEYRIDIKQINDSKFEVELDKKKIEVDLIHSEHSLYSLIIEGRSYEVNIDGVNGNCSIHIDGIHYLINVINEKKKAKIRVSGLDDVAGKLEVKSSMPGKVIKILVEQGENIEEGQGLVVLEAMKMENEISSPKKGKITSIIVKEGETVKGDVKLLTIE